MRGHAAARLRENNVGLTSAMYTGLTGMNVNQTRIATIGHNIANVNTTAFKASRTLFQTQFSQLISAGQGPTDTSGGVNPFQIGLGAVVGTTQRDHNAGSLETTGIGSDMAIQGNGMFVLKRPNGQQAYTRDGSFSVGPTNRLVSIDGNRVMGFGVDEQFNVLPTVLTELEIPLGALTLARATENVRLDGDLSAAGTAATQGSIQASQSFISGSGGQATAATPLTDLRSASAPGVSLFSDGNTITIGGATRGGRAVPRQVFTVGADGSTLGDFASWLEGALGIQNIDGVPGDPGVTIANGALVIQSNAGTENAIEITGNDILTNSIAGAAPFTFTENQAANGASVFTAFTAYDSLGAPVIVNATFTMEESTVTGPVWRFYLDSVNPDGSLQPLGTGTASFDNNGNFVSATGTQVAIDRGSTGAASPLNFTLDLSQINGLSTLTSNVIMADQDGFPPGTLNNFTVGPDGTINGTFSNGMTRTLGQVAVAVFANPQGLLAESDNLYLAGPNSGAATITQAGQFNAGTILGGALELSNVDLSREFIGLITSSTGFQAASRVISTSNDLLDQLLLVIR